MAPRGRRSLLRRPRTGPWGRRVTSHGPWRTSVRRQTLRPRLRVRRAARCGKRQLAGARFGRCDRIGKALVVCGIGVAVVWSGAGSALADTTPPPTTTTSEAPPPDPYAPQVRTVKPKPAAPRRTYTQPARTYTPPASVAPRPAVQSSRPRRQAKTVRHHRKQHPVRHPAKAPPASTWLAPLPRVVAAAGVPLPAVNERNHPYLWLAGIAFAVLAVAGLSLQMLSMRYLDPRFE